MALCLSILDKKRLAVFRQLSAFNQYGFLAGGTALALQLGHRISIDFDVFCQQEINNKLINKIRKKFKIKNVLINNNDEFTFLTANNIKITFLYYPFKFRGALIKNGSFPNLLRFENIAAAKAYTIGRRNSWRDYVDLYFVLKYKKVSLNKLIRLAKNIFKELFNEKLFLAKLLYTNDIDKNETKEVEIIKEKVSIKKVENYFKKQVDEYIKL